MDVKSLSPSDLGISKVSYDDIFNGKVDNLLPMTLVQKGVVKAYHKICVDENKNTFVPVSAKKIFDHLKNTPIKEFIPKDGVDPDVTILVHRGWFKKHDDCFVFTDDAKGALFNLDTNGQSKKKERKH